MQATRNNKTIVVRPVKIYSLQESRENLAWKSCAPQCTRRPTHRLKFVLRVSGTISNSQAQVFPSLPHKQSEIWHSK